MLPIVERDNVDNADTNATRDNRLYPATQGVACPIKQSCLGIPLLMVKDSEMHVKCSDEYAKSGS